MAAEGRPDLVELLGEAARRGFLGPRPVEEHISHAEGFAAAVDRPPRLAVDLGSGGGVPGLVLAERWADSHWLLVDAMGKRCRFLEEAVAALRLAGRVEVRCGRIEDLVRSGEGLRGCADLVTARGFGPPPAVAEAAAPLLRVGGRLVVSEPPGSGGERWPADGLAAVGLRLERLVRPAAGYAVLVLDRQAPGELPRSAKQQQRRPLFHVERPADG